MLQSMGLQRVRHKRLDNNIQIWKQVRTARKILK